MRGFVSLVGAGPGDAGLLTARAIRRLQQADVIVYDRLISPRSLSYASPQARCIYVGKAASQHTMPQAQITSLLVELGRQGRRVVRLKGGDPFVFGRGGEEAAALAEAHIEYEIVPGITSAVGAAAYAGIPVTHRGVATGFSVLTGHLAAENTLSDADWAMLQNPSRTLVFLMGVAGLGSIVTRLLQAGRDAATPVALVRYGSRAAQATVTGTLADIEQRVAAAGLESPAIIVVGGAVALRQELAWAEQRPLAGLRIAAVTDEAERARAIADEVEDLGAEVFDFSVEYCRQSDDLARTDSPLHAAWQLLDAPFDVVLCTSAEAQRLFVHSLSRVHPDWLPDEAQIFDASPRLRMLVGQ